MRLCILEPSWQIKRIDAFIRIEGNIEIGSSYRIDERFVFVFWIQNNHIRSHHERSEDFEFYRKRFTSSGFRKHTHIRIFRTKSIKDNE